MLPIPPRVEESASSAMSEFSKKRFRLLCWFLSLRMRMQTAPPHPAAQRRGAGCSTQKLVIFCFVFFCAPLCLLVARSLPPPQVPGVHPLRSSSSLHFFLRWAFRGRRTLCRPQTAASISILRIDWFIGFIDGANGFRIKIKNCNKVLNYLNLIIHYTWIVLNLRKKIQTQIFLWKGEYW